MSGSNALALAVGGLVVVALSFGAGVLGGSSVASDANVTAPAPRTVPDSVVRDRIEELDRRLGNVEERLRIVADTADAALTRTHEIDALRRAIDALRNGNTLPVAPERPSDSDNTTSTDSGPPQAEPLTDEQRAEREAAQVEKLREQAKRLAESHAEPLLKQQLSRIADATAQGAADRNSQLYAEAKMLARQYAMTAEEEDRVREILTATNESAVREVAPYLGGGLERADHATLKTKLFEVWDARDARMVDVLDENELEDYRTTQKGWREAYAKVLDAWDSARLGNR